MTKTVRRRIRPSVVCTRCKIRKTRCDKGRPCSSCVRHNHPCSYDSGWTPEILPTEGVAPSIGYDPPSEKHDMVLLPRAKYDRLIKASGTLDHIGDEEAIVAPIAVGSAGHWALNCNLGLLEKPLHDVRQPGLLIDGKEQWPLSFEPHVVKLVKHDFCGVNPFQRHADVLSMHAPFVRSAPGEPTIWEREGVFTWAAVRKKDPWHDALTRHLAQRCGSEPLDGLGDAASRQRFAREMPKPKQFAPEAFVGPLGVQHAQADLGPQGVAEHVGPFGKMDMDSDLGLILYAGSFRPGLRMVQQMQLVFPPRHALWGLFHRFFQVLYPFAPYLDEMHFGAAVEHLVGPENAEAPVALNVCNTVDLLHAAILLVVLRLSYVSLFPNTEVPHSGLRAYPVDLNAIRVAHRCLQEFMFTRIVNVPMFQLALLLRTYSYHAPEEGDGSDGVGAQLLHLLLAHMAYALGFNRDPDNFPGAVSPRTSNFIRKIMIHLSVSDMFQGYRYGNPILTNTSFFDTKYPQPAPGAENIGDVELDHAVCRILSCSDALLDGAMKRLVDLSLNVRQPMHVSYLTLLLNAMELETWGVCGRLRDYLAPLEVASPAYAYGKLMKCALAMLLESFFLTIWCHLMLFYKSEGNKQLHAYYYKKILFFALDEICVVFPGLVAKLEVFFGDGGALFMNPVIIDAVYRVHEILIASIMKCNCYLYSQAAAASHEERLRDPDYHNHFTKLCEFVVILEKFSQVCMCALSLMSSRYYFAWKVLKSHQTQLQAVTDPLFFDSVCDNPKLQPGVELHNLSAGQLQELIDMLKRSLAFVEEQCLKNSRGFTIDFSLRDKTPTVLKSRRVAPVVLDLDVFMLNGFNMDIDTLWQNVSTVKEQTPLP